MIIMAMMVLQAAPLTLRDIAAMPPAAAGERVLRGQQHGRIDAIVEPGVKTLRPPGLIERELVERPVPFKQGCIRKRWKAKFHTTGTPDINAAVLGDTYSVAEIALRTGDSCPSGQYVHINPNIRPEDALTGLLTLERIRSGKSKAKFECSDETSSGLCSNDADIRRALAKMTPWAVSQVVGGFAFWLGVPGQVVTEVRFDPTRPERVEVRRRIPAPA